MIFVLDPLKPATNRLLKRFCSLFSQIAYMIFLYTFSYVVLVRMPSIPTWSELYVIGYITAFGCEKIRELLSAEPVGLR